MSSLERDARSVWIGTRIGGSLERGAVIVASAVVGVNAWASSPLRERVVHDRHRDVPKIDAFLRDLHSASDGSTKIAGVTALGLEPSLVAGPGGVRITLPSASPDVRARLAFVMLGVLGHAIYVKSLGGLLRLAALRDARRGEGALGQ